MGRAGAKAACEVVGCYMFEKPQGIGGGLGSVVFYISSRCVCVCVFNPFV